MFACASTASLAADAIVRRQTGDFPIASSITVPAGSELVFLSGTLADVAKPDAPAGSIERFGDTETQTASVLGKLGKELAASGLTHGGRREDERLHGRRSGARAAPWISRV